MTKKEPLMERSGGLIKMQNAKVYKKGREGKRFCQCELLQITFF